MTEEFSRLLNGRYHLIEQVGGGQMSTVYRAQDTKRGNMIVAVKLLNSTHEDALRKEIFRRETSALERLEHANIVEILDYSWSNESQCYFIVLEYIPRTLLDELKVHQGKQDRTWCWKLARAIADALMYAHSQGVIHRDLKPTNILLTDEGTPKLTDFGSSLLKLELGNAITVSSFWTPQYASPEQHQNKKATERSDIYSFGCMLYHLLSGQEPPSQIPPSRGITSEHIRVLGLSPRDARMLEQTVAFQPGDRLESALQLCRQLDHTKDYEPLPEITFVVTNTVRKTLFDSGFITILDNEVAGNFLLQEELGRDIPKAIFMVLDRDGSKVRLFTDRFTMLCVRHEQVPALTIIALNEAYPAELERQKQQALSVRCRWRMTARSFTLQGRSDLAVPLSQLFHQLQTHQRVLQTSRLRKNERRDFTRVWDAVLELQRKRIESAPTLTYESVIRNGDALIFSLTKPVPDNLDWSENTALAIITREKNRTHYFSVGNLLRLGEKQVHMTWSPMPTQGPSLSPSELPAQGSISLAQQEERTALDRQRRALNALLSGGTVNPRLIEILQDLSQAVFEEEDAALSFYQPSLAEDKRKAVQKALAARDLFLLQGPPGTGKTTVLAEIILQILVRKPDARILVTSQSNVAVNHILLRVAELCGEQQIEMVRIGREEKIGQGAEEWMLEQRLDSWRTEILTRTDRVLDTFKDQLKGYKQQRRHRQTRSVEEVAELEQWKTWLEDLESGVQELKTDVQRLPTLAHYLSVFQTLPAEREEVQDEYQQCQGRIAERSERISSVLAHVRSLLPEAARAAVKEDLADEQRRLRRIVLNLLGIDEEEDQITRLQQFVKDWQKVAGRTTDFAEPILERASLLAATCLIAGGRELKDREFDWAIIDEAGRATAPELLVPLVRARRAIIVGDEKQLPPMVDEGLRGEQLATIGVTRESLMKSLFGVLVEQAQEATLPVVQMLRVQHRMHPAIGRLISEVFYDGQLEHAVTEQERYHELDWLSRCVTWFSTTRLPRHEETQRGSSYYNRVEVERTTALLKRMEASYRDLGLTREVAVITPYNAQVMELETSIQPDGPNWQALRIEIAAIDAFQGRDRDIVLYSTVRSNKQAKLGFVRDRRRLNVALSRARQVLLLVGDILTLEHGRESADEANPYRGLVNYIRAHEQDCAVEYLEEE